MLLPFQVRKHPAPQGALRLHRIHRSAVWYGRQKAPSTRRCIKTIHALTYMERRFSQKAPSTRRCIKTPRATRRHQECSGQKAPSTRRCIKTRHPRSPLPCCSQKAPSTRRCIKTVYHPHLGDRILCRQKAPSTTRCIKTPSAWPDA